MISEKGKDAVISILGDDFFEELNKSEIGSSVGGIVNARSKTSVSPEEVKIALQIVPRTILSFLFAHLKHRPEGDVFTLDLPFSPGAQILVNKKGPDNYNGEITQEGKRLIEYKHRSLPSIGLLILSTFELYDMALLDEIKKDTIKNDDSPDKLQDMIDERLTMHRMVQDVVDRRISQKEALDQLIKERLHSHIMLVNSVQEGKRDMEETKKSKLKQFLENRENKRQEPVELDKNEIQCPDCATTLYKGGEDKIKLCICYGEFHNEDIKIQKSEKKEVKLKFPRKFDTDNVEMLLEALNNEKVD